MAKNLYLRLALMNVRRSKEVYIPYFLTTMIMSMVYFLILAMIFSPGISNVPGGQTATAMFTMGLVLFTLFAFGFMLYINAFLVKRRKKEFGLYSVLGMSRRHVARVLRFETLITIGLGLLAGILLGIAFGRLVFLLLLHIMRAAVPGSTFQLPAAAFIGTVGLFALAFIASNIYNSYRVRVATTVDLLQSDKRGEKDSKLVIPAAIAGLLLLLAAYAAAWLFDDPVLALTLFFPDAFVVIIATFLLFYAGSIALLRALRRNKKLYYKSDNFVAISGMFHRMRANARGLSSICIFCTMLLVTAAGASALYFGQEEIARTNYPYDIRVYLRAYSGDTPLTDAEMDTLLAGMENTLDALASEHNVRLEAALDERVTPALDDTLQLGGITYSRDTPPVQLRNAIAINSWLYFDVNGADTDAEALVEALAQNENVMRVDTIYEMRRSGYGMYGGLLFLAAFFTILFLLMMAMMIYFKQITEGNEDKERFAIMQKVGMQDSEVKRTINKQILWVFFLPLLLAVCHMLACSRMVTRMISLFGLLDYSLTLSCIAIVSVLFGLIYLLVYRQTAKAYYKIVKR